MNMCEELEILLSFQAANLNKNPLEFLSPPQSQFSLEIQTQILHIQHLLLGTQQTLTLQQPQPSNPQVNHHHQNALVIPQPYNQAQFNTRFLYNYNNNNNALGEDLDFVILNLNDTIKNLSRILNDYGILTGLLNNEIQNINALNRNELIIPPNNQAEFDPNNHNNALGGSFDNVVLNLNVISKSLSEFLNDNHILAGRLDYGIQNIPRLPYNYYSNNNNHNIAHLVGAVQNLNKINKNISQILNGHRVLSGHLDNGIRNISRLPYNYCNNNNHNNGHIANVVLSLNVLNKSLSVILNNCGVLDGHLNDEIQNINALNRNLSKIFNNFNQ
nr:15577_t:CDS:2 [Entrophospora candida]